MLVLLPGGILVTPAVAAHFLGLPNKASLRAVQHSAEYLPLTGRGPDVR